ncbi:MAG: class I SAM-dependent DNA methyltransferase [Acidobacteria bacterium]|nr:class I SAM-dependent DNA methyltransferase [Acidobacteriota bacterium]
MPADPFIQRWQDSAAAERANYALFLSELCDFLEVPRPHPAVADLRQNEYVFERPVTFRHATGATSSGFIDLYKRGCFVLEAKQGSDATDPSLLFETPRRRGSGVRGSTGWDESMLRARNQAEQYAKALPAAEGWPPFLIVVDVGYSIELFADFSGTGKAYVPFPDSLTHRTLLRELAQDQVRARLRGIWLDPLALDPSRISARVTRDVALQLADLARDLEKDHKPEAVAAFLMRCIFTFFAEDIHLLPKDSFSRLLASLRDDLRNFRPMVESLWTTMNSGGFSPILREHVLRFNGGLFESVEALPLNRRQFDLLCRAAAAEWKDVEPAIFGTLLERALSERERHALGAHYTPRAYVERLVIPTVVEPLRRDWSDVQTAALTLERAGKTGEAIDTLMEFRRKLCTIQVLDPACGSGNFLYVTLEHLKRLEAEVNDMLESLGESQQSLQETGMTVDPHQLVGIELNPRAAAITDLVLWIGYLQWYFRTWGASTTPPEPVIKRFHNIEHRDALITYDAAVPLLDEQGRPVTTWNGIGMRKHPVTGEEVPDETARRPVFSYPGARRAEWPPAQFIVGNPPFLGNWRMRGELGDGYTETLRSVYAEVPETADFVMYWWHRAAERVRSGETRRFGFITTNSLRQTFQRRVIEPHLTDAATPASLVFAIPDHPWVDSAEGAAVRIAMTVAQGGAGEGLLLRVEAETPGEGEGAAKVEFSERHGVIHPDLTIGPNIAATVPLRANQGLSCRGVVLHGAGFILTPEEARELGLGRVAGLEQHIRLYRNGRDLTSRPRGVMVIDLFGLSADEVRDRFPEVFQWVYLRVKPERDANKRASRRENWWLFGEPISTFRPALLGPPRYIATVETSKHRFFVFLDASILPDNMLVNIASSDAFLLGVLSSRIHVTWALAAGGTLEDRPRYNKTRCFEPFPFPDASAAQRERIRLLGEQLDAHRKRQQEAHSTLTITGMYNVLEELREGRPLNATSQAIHDQGLVSVLRELHDDLDHAVAEAYGWPADLSTEDILFRLVELNAARAAEERAGRVRWLRPEFQRTAATQTGLAVEMEEEEVQPVRAGRLAWPSSLPERVRAVRDFLMQSPDPVPAETVARGFLRARAPEVKAILETLAALGRATRQDNGYRA